MWILNEIKKTSLLTVNSGNALDTLAVLNVSTPYDIPVVDENARFTGIYFELFFSDTSLNLLDTLTLMEFIDSTWTPVLTIQKPRENLVIKKNSQDLRRYLRSLRFVNTINRLMQEFFHLQMLLPSLIQ